MSATNFLNNFTNGFMFGMLNNSNPFFGAGMGNFGGFGGFGGFGNFGGFGSCFSPQPLFFNACNSFTPYTGCCTTPFPNKTSLFMVPNVMSGASFSQLMPDINPPAFNFNFAPTNSISFGANNTMTNFWGNTNFSSTPSTNFDFSPKFNFFENAGWLTNTKTDSTNKSTTEISYDAKELKQKWSSKKSGLSDAFYNKVVDVAKKVKCSPDDLMGVMYSECRLDTKVQNKKSNATGLIQFMPKTAENLGTSIDALKKMSAEEQMTYVEKFLIANKKAAGYSSSDSIDAGTLYALVFLPAKAKNDVLSTKKDKYYAGNSGLDTDKDGKITKNELASRVQSYYA